MAYSDPVAVSALKLRDQFGDDAEAEAQRLMDEAAGRSGTDWSHWMQVRDSLRRYRDD